ncbi:MAG: ester cyclase [Streptosporangiaceae bacterium]|nr:ester cyclase [Streptosporangiaceae bacterium]
MANTTPAENKEIVRRFFDQVVNERNVSALQDFLSPDAVARSGEKTFDDIVQEVRSAAPDPGTGERLLPKAAAERGGRPELAAWVDATMHILEAFPDLRVNIELMVAEGDTVVVRWTARPTQRGEFLGTPATGREVPMTVVDILTIENGKIASVTSQPDGAGVLHALGQLPDTPITRALART